MIRIVGVKYREGCKVYNFDAGELDLALGDTVIVDSEQGVGAATVASEVQEVERPPSGKPLKKVMRKARDDDFRRLERNAELEAEAFRVCQQKILEREMIMKLVRVEWALDNSKSTFYFTADGRVDFRDLVKDLAYRFKIRIEMRQIGVRDEAKMLGGYGPCGRSLCCSTFLKDFEPVSIRMAKKQDLVLNPAKISGICGRLMCCLGYEYSFYDEAKKEAKRLKMKEAEAAKAALEAGVTPDAASAPAAPAAPGQRPGSGRGPRPEGPRPEGQRRRGPKQPQSGRPGGQPGQPGQKPQGQRPPAKPSDKQNEKQPDRQGDRPDRQNTGRPQDGAAGRPAERPGEPGSPCSPSSPSSDGTSDKPRRKRSAWRKRRNKGGEGGESGGGNPQTPPDKPSGGGAPA